MQDRFNLADMLKEIEEIEKGGLAGEKVQVSQDDILKMLSMKLDGDTGEGGPAKKTVKAAGGKPKTEPARRKNVPGDSP